MRTQSRLTVTGFNETGVGWEQDACVHELFKEQAALSPDRCVVNDEGTVLTYRALDERANAVATRLRALGIGTGATVGMRLDRSADAIVAMLGVLGAFPFSRDFVASPAHLDGACRGTLESTHSLSIELVVEDGDGHLRATRSSVAPHVLIAIPWTTLPFDTGCGSQLEPA